MDEGHGVWVGSFPLSLALSWFRSRFCICVRKPESCWSKVASFSAADLFCDEVLRMLPDTVKPRTGRSHAYTLKYFFLVPKDDDDDETLFDLNTFFLHGGIKEQRANRAPKLPNDFSRPFRPVPCPQTGTSGGRHRQLTIRTSFGRGRAK